METRWGKRYGRYEIIAELGRGAMGVVYKARDPKIDRLVAVKTISLSNQAAEEEREYRDRFFHEAQAAGRLLHPGIVTIFDTGEEPENHVAYIVMEYVAGQSLERLLAEEAKKLPLHTALLLAAELAEALDHAHAQGVIHRDMKPANILVTHDGHAKIADFGIAKMNLAQLTLPGRVLGTPAYMSPEQLEGEPVDARSDLFSLGAILYRMVTGYGPFQGNSATTVCFKVANREPLRATALNSELPPECDAVIARAMAKDPAQRYQRGLEFALDLQELRDRVQAVPSGASDIRGPLREREDEARCARDEKGAASSPRRLLTSIPPKVQPKWRVPSLSMGIALLVAIIIVKVLPHVHGQPTESSTRPAIPVTLGTNGEPPIPASLSQSVDQTVTKPDSSRVRSPIAKDSTLDLRIEHRFSSPELLLWIDDNLTYDHPLRGQTKKHWNPLRLDVRETEAIPLTSGQHRLRVRVRSTPEKYDQSATIQGTFIKGVPTILQVNFERRGEAMHLALR